MLRNSESVWTLLEKEDGVHEVNAVVTTQAQFDTCREARYFLFLSSSEAGTTCFATRN
jgi:hypothetical protein